MKKVLLLLLLLTACIQPYEQPVKPEPVEITKVVVKCWDNSTVLSASECPPEPEPSVEVSEPVIVEPIIANDSRQIAEVLLDEALTKFKTHAYLIEDRLVIIHGNNSRHYFFGLHELSDGTPVTDVYVDSEAKAAVAYCDIDRESRMESRSFDYDRSKCRDFLDKPVSVDYDDWIPRGPLDYLEEFKNLKPTLIENNTQTVSIGGTSKTVHPSLHYDVRGDKFIIRIDKRYKVPVKIEKNGVSLLDFRDTYFDVMVVEGKPQKITKEWVIYDGVSDYWLKQ